MNAAWSASTAPCGMPPAAVIWVNSSSSRRSAAHGPGGPVPAQLLQPCPGVAAPGDQGDRRAGHGPGEVPVGERDVRRVVAGGPGRRQLDVFEHGEDPPGQVGGLVVMRD